MKITIDNIDHEYLPDYPDGWEKKFQDYFKFPVLVGEKELFIKRFERKPLAFDLLSILKDGAQSSGIPAIYAFKYSKEDEALFLFQEYIRGDELNKKIKGIFTLNLKDYAKDIFQALSFIHKYDFWHTDFTIENILVDEQKNFYLIDIDSCKPLSEIASSENIKDASFSGSVFANLKRVNPNFQYGDLDGVQINNLQLLFSILHFFNFTKNRGNEIYAGFSANNTSNHSKELVPFIDEILWKAMEEGIGYDDIQEVVDYIIGQGYAKAILSNQPSDSSEHSIKTEKIIDSSESSEEANYAEIDKEEPLVFSKESSEEIKEPVVQSFEINGLTRKRISLKYGEQYMLSWAVLHASHIDLDGEIIPVNKRTKYIKATQTKIHRLTAINQNISLIKRSQTSTIQIKVENKPDELNRELQLVPLKAELVYFTVNGKSSGIRVRPNKKVTISWNVNNVAFVKVNGKKNRAKDNFTKIIKSPYTFILEFDGVKKSIHVSTEKNKPALKPEISTFKINQEEKQHISIKSGDIINLTWVVKNTNETRLYKDGIEIKLSKEQKENGFFILREHNSDKLQRAVELRLVAIAKGNKKIEKTRNIWLQPKGNKKIITFLIIIIFTLLFLVLYIVFGGLLLNT